MRAVGENPAAVEAQGLDVIRLRIGAVVAGSALMALGGAFLTMSAFNAFFFEMTGGRGWICIALTVFASWRPGKALLGALLFGAFDAFQLRLQTQIGGVVPGQVFLMMPYLLSIAALLRDRAAGGLSEGADDPLHQGPALNSGAAMTFDLLVRNATLPDGRTGVDIAVLGRPHRRGGEPASTPRPARTIDAGGHLVSAALRRRAFPHGRDALARPAAPQPSPARCSRASRSGAS